MQILVTGSRGFVGSNLCARLGTVPGVRVVEFHRGSPAPDLPALIDASDVVFHLAGVNRTDDESLFASVNVGLTETICAAVSRAGSAKRVLFASSAQASNSSPYGLSKRRAETCLEQLRSIQGMSVAICRYPNIFGKWSRPYYNSAVATFCHRAARGEPLEIHDRDAVLSLMYVDDVVDQMVRFASDGDVAAVEDMNPVHRTTVGHLADTIAGFARGRVSGEVGDVGAGLVRALYSTFISHLPNDAFAYPLVRHQDRRGVFVEMLKTPSSGQVSYFTAGAGVTRGSHYHHSKTEKFLVVKGEARFRFRHVITGEKVEYSITADMSRVVESIPGWAHDVTNVGEGELIVVLWSNEVFDPQRPDTFPAVLG